MRHHFIALAGLLAFRVALGAEATVAIRFLPPPAAPIDIVLRAKAVDGRMAPVSMEARIDGGSSIATLAVPGDGSWIASLDAPGYWASPLPVGGSLAGEMRAYRTEVVVGKAAAATGGAISLRLEGHPDSAVPPSREPFPCLGQPDGSFRCEAPGGPWGFSLRLAGHAPIYMFQTSFGSGGSTDVGPVSFEPGASVSGFVRLEAGKLEPSKVTVLGRPEGSKVAPQSFRIAANGFFQITKAPPGPYLLLASQPGLAPDRRRIEVLAGFEASLDQPLVLSPPCRLELTVAPPAGPDGQPWRVETLETAADGRPEIRSAPPLLEGFLSWNGLGKGRSYRIRLLTSAGIAWYADTQPFVADKPVVRRSIELQSEKTRGVVLLGRSPLPKAVLTFGGKYEEVQVRFFANDEGRFEGLLPRIGEWKVHVSATDPLVGREVKANVVRAADGYGDVEVRLDDVAIRGEIVDEKGSLYEPQAILRVNQLSATGRPYYSDHVVKGGRFTLSGLPNGSFTAHVDLEDVASDDVRFEVKADEETPPLQVVLRPKRDLRIRVVNVAGRPLGGLRVLFLPSTESPSSFLSGAITDANGRAHAAGRPSDTSRCVVLMGSDLGLPSMFVSVPVDGKEETLTLPPVGGTLDLTSVPSMSAAEVGSGCCWLHVPTLRDHVNRRARDRGTLYLAPGEYRLWPALPAAWQTPPLWSGFLNAGETLTPPTGATR